MTAPAAGFERLLRHYHLAELEQHHGSIYGIWSDMRLAYVNPAWYRFARENGGEPAISTRWKPGAFVLDAYSGALGTFYRTAYTRCLESQQPWMHRYECSSRDLYRQFHQIVYPIEQGCLLVVNSLVLESPHDPVGMHRQIPDESIYRNRHGYIHQCAHCRRVQRPKEEQRWDWVAEWVEQIPPATSHTFCPTCFGYYYPID